jgi:hypothetical protein
MQYVLLIHQGTTPLPGTEAWAALSADEQNQVYADYAALNALPGVTPGLPLGLPERATTVRVQDSRLSATDGPVNGSKDAIGGWLVVEADDLDAALEIAGKIPAARLGGAIEVRPVQVYW